jgi:hypothetical protein
MRCLRGAALRWQHALQAKAKVLAEEERALSELRSQLTARERQWHETAAEHASTAATAQVPIHVPSSPSMPTAYILMCAVPAISTSLLALLPAR